MKSNYFKPIRQPACSSSFLGSQAGGGGGGALSPFVGRSGEAGAGRGPSTAHRRGNECRRWHWWPPSLPEALPPSWCGLRGGGEKSRSEQSRNRSVSRAAMGGGGQHEGSPSTSGQPNNTGTEAGMSPDFSDAKSLNIATGALTITTEEPPTLGPPIPHRISRLSFTSSLPLTPGLSSHLSPCRSVHPR